MKFKLLLWGLAFMMKRASKKNADFRKKLEDQDLSFEICTQDNNIARHYKIKNQRISSGGGRIENPAFSLSFKDADTGLAIMSDKDKNAFMKGIQNKDIVVTGDLSKLLWFQSISKYLKPSKKK